MNEQLWGLQQRTMFELDMVNQDWDEPRPDQPRQPWSFIRRVFLSWQQRAETDLVPSREVHFAEPMTVD